jgi:hypothetical protein
VNEYFLDETGSTSVIGARRMKSVLTKRNKQKINTGNFENIDVLVEITEELEWDSKEEQ